MDGYPKFFIICLLISIFILVVLAEYQNIDVDEGYDDIDDSYGNYAYLKCLARGYYDCGDPHYRKVDLATERGCHNGEVGYVEWADVLWYSLTILTTRENIYKDSFTYGDYYAYFYERPLGYGDPIIYYAEIVADTTVHIYSPDDLPDIPLHSVAYVEKR